MMSSGGVFDDGVVGHDVSELHGDERNEGDGLVLVLGCIGGDDEEGAVDLDVLNCLRAVGI